MHRLYDVSSSTMSCGCLWLRTTTQRITQSYSEDIERLMLLGLLHLTHFLKKCVPVGNCETVAFMPSCWSFFWPKSVAICPWFMFVRYTNKSLFSTFFSWRSFYLAKQFIMNLSCLVNNFLQLAHIQCFCLSSVVLHTYMYVISIFAWTLSSIKREKSPSSFSIFLLLHQKTALAVFPTLPRHEHVFSFFFVMKHKSFWIHDFPGDVFLVFWTWHKLPVCC